MLNIRGVTIVLIGGRLTLTDGTQLDSRQPAEGPATARALRSAITSSTEWWEVVSSIVLPTLEGDGPGYALVVGARTVARTLADGEVRRSSLRRWLEGGVGTVTVVRSGINSRLPPKHLHIATLRASQGEHMGELGFHTDRGTPRWRFFGGSDFCLRALGGRLGARVVVDAGGAFLEHAFRSDLGSLSADFKDDPTTSPPKVVVVPDVPAVREQVDALLAGRAVESSGEDAVTAEEYDPSAPRHSADFLRLVAVRVECQVSGVILDGGLEDGTDLEAARLLLLRRFDLKLGLWDLALNPVLRSTVLDPAPPTVAPGAPVEAPLVARRRAEREAERATARREAARSGIHRVAIALHGELRATGWRMDDQGRLSRPLTEPLSRGRDSETSPLAELRIEVTKTTVRVVVWHWLYNNLDLGAFVRGRRAAFESVAGLPPAVRDIASVRLWALDAGWGNDHADWQNIGGAIAQRTKQWEALLAEFVDSCRKFAARR